MTLRKTLLSSISLLGVALGGAAAQAQTANDSSGGVQTPTGPAPTAGTPIMGAAPPPPSTPAPKSDNGGIQEIIVTAQKREENINKVGLTIAAIGSQALAERNIQTLADIAASVPGLTYVNSANNTPVYNLRGVGFYDTSLGSYPTTSVYVDQVPLPFPVLTNLTAFDLQRIEVLKGPQGTLFGQNSTGGAINYIAAKPTSELKAGFDASYGRFDDFIGDGYVSGPITDTLRARVAAHGEKSGPWQYSYTRPDDKNGRNDNLAGRILLDWDAASNLKFELNVNGWHDQNQPEAVQYFKFNQQAITNVQEPVRDYPFAPADPRAADWSTDNGMYRNLKFGQVSLRGDWEFVPGITLTSITSYIGFNERGALDQDGINFDDIDLRFFTGNIHSFSQELRVANSGPGPFRWIVGANYSRDHVYYRENIVYGDGSGGNNQAPPFQIESSENYSDQFMRNYAVFGNAEYEITPEIKLKGGVRYTEAQRKADICNLDGTTTPDGGPANRNFPVGGANRLFSFLQDIFSGQNYPDIMPGQCFNLNDPNPENVNENNLGPYQAGLFTAHINEHNVSWRGGVDYKPSNNLLLYVNVAKGYKAGGFGNINAAIDFQFRPVHQESILNYEGGFKVQLLDHRLSISGAGFYMDYRDKQLRTKDINPIFGVIDALNNIPKSHIVGGEMEVQATPARGFNVGAAVTYLDSKIDSYTGINAGGVVADFDGTSIPFTPRWQVNVNARYERPISDDLKAFVSAQGNLRSRTFAAIGGSDDDSVTNLAPGFEINGYATMDAQIGIESGHGWRAMLWGKNITNTYYWTNVVVGQDQYVRYAQKPVTYGVTVGWDF